MAIHVGIVVGVLFQFVLIDGAIKTCLFEI